MDLRCEPIQIVKTQNPIKIQATSINQLQTPTPNPKPRIHFNQGGSIYKSGQIDIGGKAVPEQKNVQVQVPIGNARQQNILRPYIKCPQHTTIVLPKNKKTVYVKLEQPKSNINYDYVDVSPPWKKSLQAHLGAGVHTVTFKAHSPHSPSLTESCQTVITVRATNVPSVSFVPASSAPKVHFCPPTYDVQLQPHELKRAIFWSEPKFLAQQPLKHIFKTHSSGTQFSVGQHTVTYIASDVRGQNGTCQFEVIVRPPGELNEYFLLFFCVF